MDPKRPGSEEPNRTVVVVAVVMATEMGVAMAMTMARVLVLEPAMRDARRGGGDGE